MKYEPIHVYSKIIDNCFKNSNIKINKICINNVHLWQLDQKLTVCLIYNLEKLDTNKEITVSIKNHVLELPFSEPQLFNEELQEKIRSFVIIQTMILLRKF